MKKNQDIQSANQKKRIKTLLRDSVAVTGTGVLYQGLHDNALLIEAPLCDFCRFCLDHPKTASLCRYACKRATMESLSSGDAHYQRCWAGLLFTTIAIAPDNACCGGISLGGFRGMDEQQDIQDTVQQAIANISERERTQFMSRLSSIKEVSPSALRGLGHFLLEASISSGMNSERFFRRQNEKYRQQRSIAEAFEDMRKTDVLPADILQDTHDLITFLYTRDRDSVMRFVSTYLARLLMASNWDLTKLKAHARLLLAALSSREILQGADWPKVLGRESRRFAHVERATSTEDCCYQLSRVILAHLDGEDESPESSLSTVQRIRNWITLHYSEPVTLEDIARGIGASPSTVVHRVKAETGKTTGELLRDIRITEAKRLLASTQTPLSSIADMCGFCDQSHLTRTFKTCVNLTPGQFRRLMNFGKDDI